MNAHKTKKSGTSGISRSPKDLEPDTETELKFLILPEDIGKVLLLPPLQTAAQQAHSAQIESTYFDTPDHELWKRWFVLRIRNVENNLIQTIKHQTFSSVRRGEWERQIDGAAPDLAAIKQTPLKHWINGHRLHALQPAFEVRVERRTFMLNVGDAQIECAFDEGRIDAGDETSAVCELELELKGGEQSKLFQLARRLASKAPLHLSFISKAERGFLLAQGAWGKSAKASHPQLDAEMTCRQAFQLVCRSCLHDYMLNEASFATADRVEAIHQARIAIRRLRATMTLFKPIVLDDVYAGLHDELKWLADLLGAARDLDVLHDKIPPEIEVAASDPGLKAFSHRVEVKRQRLHGAVMEGAKTERARTLLVDLVAWIEDGDWRRQNATAANALLGSFVAERLKKRRRSLIRQSVDLEDLGPEARHRVRIEAKKLRYMAEFFIDVRDDAIARKKLKRLVQLLGDLQTSLGEMHDEETKTALVEAELQSWREEGNGLDDAAIAAAERWAAAMRDTSAELEAAVGAYRKLAKIKPF